MARGGETRTYLLHLSCVKEEGISEELLSSGTLNFKGGILRNRFKKNDVDV